MLRLFYSCVDRAYECDVRAKDEEIAAEKAMNRADKAFRGWEPEDDAEVELITEKYETADEDDFSVTAEGLVDEMDRLNDLWDEEDWEDDWSSDLD